MEYARKILLILIVTMYGITLSAQGDDTFKPGGKPVFLLFSNVHYSFDKEGGAPAFAITRLYLGYEYSFTRTLSARANIDIGDPGVGNLQMTAYVKHAFLQYKNNFFSGRIGMIAAQQYDLIEKHWGYRYIYKTLQDEYGFGPSSDLGAAVEYSPAKFISLDASVLNGEGYKQLQSDSVFKYTMGMTVRPVDGLQLRVYTDFMKKSALQNTISLFSGYTLERFRIGFEYSIQNNSRMVPGHDLYGVSAFTSIGLSENVSLLARYDQLWSSASTAGTDWNLSRDGQLFIGGIEFSPVKGIRIAPVYTGWIPSDKSKLFKSSPGLYFEIKL